MTTDALTHIQAPSQNLSLDLDATEFTQWQALIEQRSGLYFDFSKYQSLLCNVLTQRCRALNLPDHIALLDRLTEAPDAPMQWQLFIDELTIKTTRFFRDSEAYALLEAHIDTLYAQDKKRIVECWSVGCSTGEEVYSIAHTIEVCRARAQTDIDYGVTGTDINLAAIRHARTGQYDADALIHLEAGVRDALFDQTSTTSFSVKPDILAHTSFIHNNVLDIQGLYLKELDVIFCQNILLYFRKWQRKRVVDALVNCLKPGGVMILGASELSGYKHPKLKALSSSNNIVFEKQ